MKTRTHLGGAFAASLILLAGLSPIPALGQAAGDEVATGNYRLAVNDLVNVKVFQEDDLTTSARIAADGTISFPLLGTVRLAGQTAQDAARQIARSLDARFIVNPQVNVTVAGYAKRRFTILGQVAKAGAYNMQFQDSLDLLEAIGMAGGYTRAANPAKISVMRNGRVTQINGKELANGASQSFRVQPGDTITVGERLF